MAKIVFTQNLFFENLGPMYLSAVLKKFGHKVDMIIEKDIKIIKKIKQMKPDFVAFSCTTGSHIWAIKLSKKIKQIEPQIKIVMGGAHTTFFPEVIENENIDIICRGEGEKSLVELLNSYNKHDSWVNIPNLWIKEQGKIYKNKMDDLILNLDQLPFPDKELYPKSIGRNIIAGVITSRGCPYNCTFCFNNAFRKLVKEETGKGYFVRKRSIDNVLEELKILKKDYRPKMIQFRDENFTYDKDWLKEFCKIYAKEIAIPFTCQVQINEIDEKVCFSLKKAGVHCVFFGIESGNEFIRKNILKKMISNEAIIENAKLLKRFQIPFRTYNILGLPKETIKNAFETVRINQQIKTTYPWCSLLFPYRGTEIYNYFKKNECEEKKLSDLEFFFPSSQLYKNKKEILVLHKLFILTVKIPRLTPLVKIIIKMGPNILFNFIFLLSFGLVSFLSEGETFKYAFMRKFKNYRLTKRKKDEV